MWLAVEGDLRFLSHRDMMRAVERVLLRARLPLQYTQGFHPHPVVSLALPRPVGVSADEDLLVFSLAAPVTPEALLEAARPHAPRGMRFLYAAVLPPGPKPHPLRCQYELAVPDDRLETVRQALPQWRRRDQWHVERSRPAGRGRTGRAKSYPVDLKPLVADLVLDGNVLRWRQQPSGDLWARPAEVLAVAGLDPRADLARVRRTGVDYSVAGRMPALASE